MPNSGPVYQPTTVSYEQQNEWSSQPRSYLAQTVNRVNNPRCVQWSLLALGLVSIAIGIILFVEGTVFTDSHKSTITIESAESGSSIVLAVIGIILVIVGVLLEVAYVRLVHRRKGWPCFNNKSQRLTRDQDNQTNNGQILTLNPSTDLLVTSSQYNTVNEAPPTLSEEEETRKLMSGDIKDSRPFSSRSLTHSPPSLSPRRLYEARHSTPRSPHSGLYRPQHNDPRGSPHPSTYRPALTQPEPSHPLGSSYHPEETAGDSLSHPLDGSSGSPSQFYGNPHDSQSQRDELSFGSLDGSRNDALGSPDNSRLLNGTPNDAPGSLDFDRFPQGSPASPSSSLPLGTRLLKALRAPLASVEDVTSSLESSSAWSMTSRRDSTARARLVEEQETVSGMTASRFSV